jgi:hypothetical protein
MTGTERKDKAVVDGFTPNDFIVTLHSKSGPPLKYVGGDGGAGGIFPNVCSLA